MENAKRPIDLVKIVRMVIKSYATRGYNNAGEPGRLYYVENIQDQVFAAIAPFDPVRKDGGMVLMARINGEQIIIDTDKTSVSLSEELHRAGIPESQITVSWASSQSAHSPVGKT